MSISDLIPTLRPMVESLNTQFRFICFFILTAALIVRTSTGHKSISHLLRPIITNVVLCALIASLPTWFNLIRDGFWAIAVSIRTEFTGSLTGTGTALLNLLQAPDNADNWLDVEGSIEKAFQYALGWMLVWFAGIIQLPMMIIQYVMECLCYLFLPVALCLFAFESTKGLAIHYIQQTLAVLAWPIGFAVVDLVGFSLLTTTANTFTGGTSDHGNTPIFSPRGGCIRWRRRHLADSWQPRHADHHAEALLLGFAALVRRGSSTPDGDGPDRLGRISW